MSLAATTTCRLQLCTVMGAQPESYGVPVIPVAFGMKILREFLSANTVECFVDILVRALS